MGHFSPSALFVITVISSNSVFLITALDVIHNSEKSILSDLLINLDKKMISNFESIDFSELCITSSAIIKKTLSDEITVITNKAEGEKCSICWKINKNGCERHLK